MDNKVAVVELPHLNYVLGGKPIHRIKVKIIGVTELITAPFPMKSRVMINVVEKIN